MKNETSRGSNIRYKPPFKFGLGGVPLGNEFAVVRIKMRMRFWKRLGARAFAIMTFLPGMAWASPRGAMVTFFTPKKKRIYHFVQSGQTAKGIADSQRERLVSFFALSQRGDFRLHGCRREAFDRR